MTCDYAKRNVLTSLLSLVRRLRFTQSYTVTPTERGKNRRLKDEIPQQPGTQRAPQRAVLLCKVFTCHNQSPVTPVPGGYTELHLETFKQNSTVGFSEGRSAYKLRVRLLAVQCQPNSAAIHSSG